MIDKTSFLKIVKSFTREDFRDYLYRDINKKRKLLNVVVIVNDNEIEKYKSLI